MCWSSGLQEQRKDVCTSTETTAVGWIECNSVVFFHIHIQNWPSSPWEDVRGLDRVWKTFYIPSWRQAAIDKVSFYFETHLYNSCLCSGNSWSSDCWRRLRRRWSSSAEPSVRVSETFSIFYLSTEKVKCLGGNMDQQEDYQEMEIVDRRSRGDYFELIVSSQEMLCKTQQLEIICILANYIVLLYLFSAKACLTVWYWFWMGSQAFYAS